jgi:4-diphosphocytidyl-2-C-methyl-D-erythritol kinase
MTAADPAAAARLHRDSCRGVLRDRAPAKVNLTLRILGRRADGYHELESLVAFAGLADELTFVPEVPLALALEGPTASQAGPRDDNLVLKAARAAAERITGLRLGSFALTKRLPAGGGLGGGSSDAATALRLIARANALSLDDPRLAAAALATGADVPVCLAAEPRIMRGVGEALGRPLALPALPAVLAGPGFPLATKDVFAALGLKPGERTGAGALNDAAVPTEREALLRFLEAHPNDLEAPALRLAPPIGDLLVGLRGEPGCRLARMSGSGTTCFGLFDTQSDAEIAANRLSAAHPTWWVEATTLGSSGF